jgi:hypothetical protein
MGKIAVMQGEVMIRPFLSGKYLPKAAAKS